MSTRLLVQTATFAEPGDLKLHDAIALGTPTRSGRTEVMDRVPAQAAT